MKFLKNIILLATVLVLSYYTAEYFGTLYDKFSPLYSSSLFLPLPKEALIILAGGPFAYIFFTILGFQTLGSGNRNKWTLWLLAPAALFFASGDLRHFYLPVILGLIAFGTSKIINKILIKNEQGSGKSIQSPR